jgi:flagellar hook-basal body complex protein FliE
MNDIDTSKLLVEMQQMAAQARRIESGQEAEPGQFSQLLASSIDKVNETQQSASAMAEAFERGSEDVTLAEVMIAMQKASLSFQAMTEVRNRLVSAYQEIMNMPI